MIRVVPPGSPDQEPDFLPIPDPGSWIQESKRHRIPDLDPQHSSVSFSFLCRSPYSKEELYFNKCHIVLQFKRRMGAYESSTKFRYQYLSAVFKNQTYCFWIRTLTFCRIRIWIGSRFTESGSRLF
jgi:hypothetical protein